MFQPLHGFSRGSHSCGTLPKLFPIGSEPGNWTLWQPFWQAPWKFLLDLSNKGAIESNSHYNKFISRKKGSIKFPTATRTPGKPCKIVPWVCMPKLTTKDTFSSRPNFQRTHVWAGVDGAKRTTSQQGRKLQFPSRHHCALLTVFFSFFGLLPSLSLFPVSTPTHTRARTPEVLENLNFSITAPDALFIRRVIEWPASPANGRRVRACVMRLWRWGEGKVSCFRELLLLLQETHHARGTDAIPNSLNGNNSFCPGPRPPPPSSSLVHSDKCIGLKITFLAVPVRVRYWFWRPSGSWGRKSRGHELLSYVPNSVNRRVWGVKLRWDECAPGGPCTSSSSNPLRAYDIFTETSLFLFDVGYWFIRLDILLHHFIRKI